MILLIDTSDVAKLFVGLFEEGKYIKKKTLDAQYAHAEKLLPAIDELVGKKKLEAIAVVSGPGSFTALRIGVVTANALSYSLKIPVVSVAVSEFNDTKKMPNLIKQRLAKVAVGGLVEPEYGKAPNITKKK